MRKIAIGLVDDHQLVIDGLKSLLDNDQRFEIAFATTKPSEVMDLLAEKKVDVLMTDIMMPALPGNELAKLVQRKYPAIKILALSMNGEGSLVNEMINESDISGYVLKNISRTELTEAIEKIAKGGIYFSDEVIEELQKSDKRTREVEKTHLTNREIEIIRLIEKEYSNKQIADELFISERTVETHRKNIFRKTGTNSVIGLVKFAYEHKLI
jgi:two-component system, NarL family, nitrate/nitrite response regulator NarL